MAVKRLHENFNIDADCCVTGSYPNMEHAPFGVYLGQNPEQPARGLYLTYWSAVEVALKIGYPDPAVQETLLKELDERNLRIEELERQLNEEVNNLAVKALQTHFDNRIKELADGQERAFRGIRDAAKGTRQGTRSAAAVKAG